MSFFICDDYGFSQFSHDREANLYSDFVKFCCYDCGHVHAYASIAFLYVLKAVNATMMFLMLMLICYATSVVSVSWFSIAISILISILISLVVV
mmetsp:Transcript_31658/g.51223  ORF Transcript_31658/g.51223 Transcript_31658/m.51223 type:complete len:94 (-) Transcript_31658:182-463(-)